MGISLHITAWVLAAALLHALWNTLVKSSDDKLVDTVAITTGAGIVSLAAVLFLPLPAPASWPWLAGSATIHFFYYGSLIGAYKWGDLSHVYPLMRGSAPPLIALASLALGEHLSSGAWTGIFLISIGIIGLGSFRRGAPRLPGKATLYAMGNAVTIAAYTVVDGQGVRLSGNAASYTLWLYLLNALPLLGLMAVWRPAGRVAAGGAMEDGRSWRDLYCGLLRHRAMGMTQAPVAV